MDTGAFLIFWGNKSSLRNVFRISEWILDQDLQESRGFSNLPWCKHALRPGTTYAIFEDILGILGALCKGNGAPLVRYLCTT